jgi:hypothetical protein
MQRRSLADSPLTPQYLLDALLSTPDLPVPDLLNKTFHVVDSRLSHLSQAGKTQSGCTAVTAFLRVEHAVDTEPRGFVNPGLTVRGLMDGKGEEELDGRSGQRAVETQEQWEEDQGFRRQVDGLEREGRRGDRGGHARAQGGCDRAKERAWVEASALHGKRWRRASGSLVSDERSPERGFAC